LNQALPNNWGSTQNESINYWHLAIAKRQVAIVLA